MKLTAKALDAAEAVLYEGGPGCQRLRFGLPVVARRKLAASK
jgi:hypothetical protein